MISMEVKCAFCPNSFTKGKGHTCWCNECSLPHLMCNDCYKELKKTGKIKDSKNSIWYINEENKNKWT